MAAPVVAQDDALREFGRMSLSATIHAGEDRRNIFVMFDGHRGREAVHQAAHPKDNGGGLTSLVTNLGSPIIIRVGIISLQSQSTCWILTGDPTEWSGCL